MIDVCDDDWEVIGKWIRDGLPYTTSQKKIDYAICVKKDGEIKVAGTILNGNGVNAFIQLRCLNPKYMNRSFIYGMFNYAFNTMKLKRLTSSIIGDNMKSIRLTKHFGFTLEGCLEGITADEQNVYYSVLRPENCKYLNR